MQALTLVFLCTISLAKLVLSRMATPQFWSCTGHARAERNPRLRGWTGRFKMSVGFYTLILFASSKGSWSGGAIIDLEIGPGEKCDLARTRPIPQQYATRLQEFH